MATGRDALGSAFFPILPASVATRSGPPHSRRSVGPLRVGSGLRVQTDRLSTAMTGRRQFLWNFRKALALRCLASGYVLNHWIRSPARADSR